MIFTWGTIFLCQLRLRQLSDRGVIPPSTFQMPGSPYTSYIGLAFLGLVVVGMAISGWQASPYFSHKVDFLVVVFGIPILAVVLALGWRFVRPSRRREHRRQAQGGVVGRRPDATARTSLPTTSTRPTKGDGLMTRIGLA